MLENKKVLVLDIETCNTLDDNFAYDVGYQIVDTFDGNIYVEGCALVGDIFCGEKELMKSAYFAEKIPSYWEQRKKGETEIISLLSLRKIIKDLMKEYGVKDVAAYNASFDARGLNKTLRHVTKSKYRWFLPFGTTVHDIWKMAKNEICATEEYKETAKREKWFCANVKRISTTAENVYKFISGKKEFSEEHKGLADVQIETEIMLECLRRNPTTESRLWVR